MAINETLTLDGLALNDGTTFTLEALEMPPPGKRWDWIAGADADGSALVRDPLFDNREITARVRVEPQSTMDLALAKIGLLVDKLEEAECQPDGLALVWTPADATKTVTFYVLSDEITGLPISVDGGDAGWFVKAPVVTVRLICKPFGYGAEVTGSTVTSSLPLITLTQAGVTGDVPAEARLVVTDMASQSRRHVEWGLEWRNYNAATSLIVESDDMITTGFAGAQTTRTGAYDPGASGNNVIRATLITQAIAVCGTGNLGHVGVFRVKARIWATSTDVRVRLGWQEGDGPFSANSYAAPAVANAFSEVDLGLISVPEKKLGTQRWTGRVEAYSTTSADTIDIDALWLIPAGEGYGVAAVPTIIETPTVFAARDEFDQTAGNVTSKTLPIGGTWAGAGDADDFTINTGTHVAQRTAVSDADLNTGRYLIAGTTTFTDVAQQVDLKATAGGPGMGMVARYIDTNNWLMVTYAIVDAGTSAQFEVRKRVAGTVTTLKSIIPSPFFGLDAFASMRLLVDSYGYWTVWLFRTQVASGFDAQLATGGALASGKSGIYDRMTGSTATTRSYDNFAAWVPANRAAIFSGQSIEVRHDDPLRKDSAGTVWGPPPSYRGSRFLLPPAGDENRTSRVAVKARRNNVDETADDQIADSTKVELWYVPRYSVIPR